VVPILRRVIEDGDAGGIGGRRLDDVLEGLVRQVGALDRLVQIVDISAMVLAVVKSKRISRDDRRERVFLVGKRRLRDRLRAGAEP